MKRKGRFLKKNHLNEDIMVKEIEHARDMTYWYSERF